MLVKDKSILILILILIDIMQIVIQTYNDNRRNRFEMALNNDDSKIISAEMISDNLVTIQDIMHAFIRYPYVNQYYNLRNSQYSLLTISNCKIKFV